MCKNCNTSAIGGNTKTAASLLMLPSGFHVGGCEQPESAANSVFKTVARMISANATTEPADNHTQPEARTDTADAAERPDEHTPDTHTFAKKDNAQHNEKTGATQRKKLWELPVETYCTVLGTCFTVGRLRQLIARKYRQKHKSSQSTLSDINQCSDYDLHVDACHVSRTRNPLSLELQKDMDTRYAEAISQCRKHAHVADLLEIWQQALSGGNVAGYIWALLTHPENTAMLTDRICKDMHMLQHHTQPQITDEREKLEAKMAALEHENATLSRALADAQRRSTANAEKRRRTVERLRTELVQLRGQSMQKDSLIAFMEEDLQQLRGDNGEKGGAAHRLEQSLVRERALEQRLKTMKRNMKKAEKRVQKLEFALHNQVLLQQAQQRAEHSMGRAGTQAKGQEQAHSTSLFSPGSKVLCVGGKSKKVPEYKVILERSGADFLHHDGGLENNQAQLENALAASDVVICQTGCISHNAYWRVKNHCKRTGKQCIYVDNPSTSSLLANLQKATLHKDTHQSAKQTEQERAHDDALPVDAQAGS